MTGLTYSPLDNFPSETQIRRRVKRSWAGSILVPRDFQAFGVGLERTGTTYLAECLPDHVRAYHEPHRYRLARMVASRDEYADEHIREWIQQRDRTLRLEFESSHLLNPFVGSLVELFPEAKFILTVRSPLPWLRSVIRWTLEHDVLRPGSPWKPVFDQYYGTEGTYRHDVMEEAGLYPIEGYLNGWRRNNRRVLEAVPSERLLVLWTSSLSEHKQDIYQFLGLSPPTDQDRRPERNRSVRGHDGLLGEIDQKWLEEVVERHCGPLLRVLKTRTHGK